MTLKTFGQYIPLITIMNSNAQHSLHSKVQYSRQCTAHNILYTAPYKTGLIMVRGELPCSSAVQLQSSVGTVKYNSVQ